MSGVDVVCGEVVRIHVDAAVLTAEGKIDIARLGHHDYTCVTEVFEMRITGSGPAAAEGLEGRES